MISEILARLEHLKNDEKARILQGFFKTGPSQYGEGDVFLGIAVPVLRKLAGEYPNTSRETVLALLSHPYHEARLFALFLLIRAFHQGTAESRREIYDAYLANTRFINNWDLVDLSAPQIVGVHLADRARTRLITLAKSSLLWERRISIVATFHFIRNREFTDTLRISDLLLPDREDLIHKAVGWMLREVGKRDLEQLETFLRVRHQVMPRTMLRYAIEKFPEEKRQKYLKGFASIQ
jgi:3-methyladenine DNA glycosylase AlkD